MDKPSITDWITAGSTVAAALAAIFAALFTRRAAVEAANAARAAADQVELQRPRPIVIARFSRYFGNRTTPDDRDQEVELENIGDSPAFDVTVSAMQVPADVPAESATARLETEPVDYLVPRTPITCRHRHHPARGLTGVMACAALFANDAKDFFNEQSKAQTTRSPDHRYEARFNISYRALDGRQFRQEYGFVVQFTQLRAWIEPVGSLIEERRAAQGA